jgi:hypothetical protein
MGRGRLLLGDTLAARPHLARGVERARAPAA